MRKNHYAHKDQETTITWNNLANDAVIHAFDRRIARRLKELATLYPDQFELMEKNSEKSVTYRIPKQYIWIQAPYRNKRDGCQTKRAEFNGGAFKITEVLQIEGER